MAETSLPPEQQEAASASYFSVTRSATYGFWSALPLIGLYEWLILTSNRDSDQPVRISSEIFLKSWLDFIDGPGVPIMLGIVVVIGVIIWAYDRRKPTPLRLGYFGGMIIESALYAVLVAFIVANLVSVLTTMFAPVALAVGQAAPVEFDLRTEIALSIGAGIYEELLFRVVLVGSLYIGIKAFFRLDTMAYVIAAVLGALVFSWIHYVGSFGDPFTVPSFLFRFLFGLALNVLFLTRGFGVAAWTHALYDIFVVTDLLG